MDFNPKCDKNELFTFLVQKGIEEDDAKKIREEKVDGETFRDISEDDLKDIGVKLGTRKKILKMIQSLKNAPKPPSFSGHAQVQDVQLVGNDSFMSNSFVFDLITSGSPCTVLPPISPPSILPTVAPTKILRKISSSSSISSSQNSTTITSSSSTSKPSVQAASSSSSALKRETADEPRFSDYARKRMRQSSKSIPKSVCDQDEAMDSYVPRTTYFDVDKIDVLALLKDHVSGDKILYNLKNRKSINRSDINEIVRICVRDMVDELRTVYPRTEQKHNLAKAIVRDIPELKSTREGVLGYEQFYDPSNNSGSIEWRLKTMRKVMPLSKKKNKSYKRRARKVIEVEEEVPIEYSEEILEKINWLKCTPAVEGNKAQILEYMADTYEIRRAYITKNCPNATEILDIYPKLKEFDGEMIEEEFNRIHPNAKKLAEELPEYTEKLSLYVSQQRHDIEERVGIVPDNNLRIMMYLADLLPVPGMKKEKLEYNRKIYPSHSLLIFTGSEIQFVLNEPFLTPTLLACGEMTDEKLQFFLIIGKEFIELGYSSLKALDILYKSFYVFNVEYPAVLVKFYNFLDHIVYGVQDGSAFAVGEHINNILRNMDK